MGHSRILIMETNLLNYVVTQLEARKGYWPQIAAETRVPYDTVSKIARRETLNPGVLTVQTLARHLHLLERQDAERRAAAA